MKDLSSGEDSLLTFLQHLAFGVGMLFGFLVLLMFIRVIQPITKHFSLDVGNFLFVILLVIFLLGGALFGTWGMTWLFSKLRRTGSKQQKDNP